MKRYFPDLDGTWRLIQRGDVGEGLDPSVDGKDCYVFQRMADPGSGFTFVNHIIPVDKFWGAP